MKAFALSFGMGVVSGIVLSYQFGTNWSVFSDKTGPVIGPLMGYEVLTAFFLEAGFLGIMLFGFDRVPKLVHFAATCIVAVGALTSAFWILSANSWMQTPVGYAVNAAGQFVPTDWLAVIFNPSFPYRLVHMVLAAYLATAFAVGAAGAYHLLNGRKGPMVPHDVLDGDVDGGARRAAAASCRRPARAEHAGAPARQGRRHGRAFRGGTGRRAADPLRLAGHAGRRNPLRGRAPEARQPDPDA